MYKCTSYKEVAKNIKTKNLEFVCYYVQKIVEANISHSHHFLC